MLSFGQLFGSSFWSSFKSQPSESIERLLSKDDWKLEELLDDSDLIQECKNSNKNLIKYLDREKIKELIDYITVMPEVDEHNRGHKYPFVANEVFNCDIHEVIEKFFTAPWDDVQPEPDEPEEDEDATKFESGFEKDKEDSNTDSDEGEHTADGTGDATNEQQKEDPSGLHSEGLKIEDFENDKDAEKTGSEPYEEKDSEGNKEDADKKVESVEIDDSDKVQEKSLDAEQKTKEKDSEEDKKEESSSPWTEDKKEEKDDDKVEDTAQKAHVQSTDAASPPTIEIEEETIEDQKDKFNDADNPKTADQTDNDKAQAWMEGKNDDQDEENKQISEDTSTHISEETSETTTTKEPAHPPLSTNKYDLLDYLTRFIETDEELNDVLAGYFARLCNILIQKKGDELATYFYTNERLLYRFAYHSYSKSLTDTVIKILDINMNKIEIEEAEIERVRQEFIKKLLERLNDGSSNVSYEYSLNIFQIFNELTFKKPFYSLLIKDEVLNTLGEILKKDSPECSSNAAIRILNVLITHLRDHVFINNAPQLCMEDDLDDNDGVVIGEAEENKDEPKKKPDDLISNHNLVVFMREQVIDHIVALLDKTPERPVMDFQYGDNQYILGKKRLACVNLMESLVELDDAQTKQKILKTDFYTKLFDLFLEYPYNTFLQLYLDNIFMRNLKDITTDEDTKVEFLDKLQIFEKLPSFWSDNQMFSFPSQREFRHGYLAFTTKMANALKEAAKEHVKILERSSSEEWKNFLENDVEVYNEKNSIVLANRGGNRNNSDLDEDDRFEDQLEERDDLEDKDDDDEDDYQITNKTDMRETLHAYSSNRMDNKLEDNFDKDDEEDNLFSGLSKNPAEEDSDEDKPIGGFSDDDSDDDSENEKEDVSENSDYYDNSYWQINQYSIEDLIEG